MVSKVFFSALVVLLVAQVAFAEPELCPEPEDAKHLVYKQSHIAIAPSSGRVEKDFNIPAPANRISCLSLVGTGAAHPAITIIGLSEDGSVLVRTVSAIQRGLDIEVDAYTKQ